MSQKTYNLTVSIIGGVSAISIALVTYFEPPYATPINASIETLATALTVIVGNFRKEIK